MPTNHVVTSSFVRYCLILQLLSPAVDGHVIIGSTSSNSRADDVTSKHMISETTKGTNSLVTHSNAFFTSLPTKSDVTTVSGRNYRSTSNDSDETSTTSGTTESVTSSGVTSSCRLRSANSSMYERVRYLVEQEHIRLIDYHLDLLLLNVTKSKSSIAERSCIRGVDHGVQLQPRDLTKSTWSRVSSGHGMALLSLDFNYAAISLLTLSVGVESVHVTITDQPTGCYNELDECRRLAVILRLLRRDLQDDLPAVSVTDEEHICHQAIVNQSGIAVFTNMCCVEDQLSGHPVCRLVDDSANEWLTILKVTIISMRVLSFVFSPLLVATICRQTAGTHRYVVNNRERPLVMSAQLVKLVKLPHGQSQNNTHIKGQRSTGTQRVIDLTQMSSDEFPKLRRSLRRLTTKRAIITRQEESTDQGRVNIRIHQFDIDIDHSKLVSENSIPIGFWRCLCEVLFKCHLSRLGPFKMCCQTHMCRVCRRRRQTQTTRHVEHGPRLPTASGSSSVKCYNEEIELSRLESEVGKQCENNFEVSAQKPRNQFNTQSGEVDEMVDDTNSRGAVILPVCTRSTSRSAEMSTKITWETFFKLIGLTTVLVVLIPAPFYGRLAIYYFFEHHEITERKLSISELGLRESFNSELLHYLTPTHPLLLLLYVSYTLIVIAIITSRILLLRSSPAPTHLSHGTHHSGHLVPATSSLLPAVVQSSLADVLGVSWLDALHSVVANLVWPFERFGLLGLLLGVVYLPVVVPLTSIIVVINCLPIVHLLIASVRHTATLIHRRCSHRQAGIQLLPVSRGRQSWPEETQSDDDDRDTAGVFHVERLLGRCDLEDIKDKLPSEEVGEADDRNGGDEVCDDAPTLEEMVEHIKRRRVSHFSFVEDNSDGSCMRRTPVTGIKRSFLRSTWLTVTSSPIIRNLLPVFSCVAYVGVVTGASFLISECVGFVTKLFVFTAMGVFANAEHLMKYFALIVVVTVYIRDCFMAIHGRFLQLNRAVFAELKSRIPDLEKVTSLPSYLQQNTAFKPVQQREVAELFSAAAERKECTQENLALSIDADKYGIPDTLTPRETVTSLALFVDRNDKPMIPRSLFDQICDIRAPGAPGPVYMAYLVAVGRFLKLILFVFFVFIVILSFGEALHVSSTNQTLATLAGGLLPLALRTLRKRKDHNSRGGGGDDNLDLSMLSFRCRLYEIIANFRQNWPPVCDFEFELELDSQLRTMSTNKCSTIDDEDEVHVSTVTNQETSKSISGSCITQSDQISVEDNSCDHLRTKVDNKHVDFVIIF